MKQLLVVIAILFFLPGYVQADQRSQLLLADAQTQASPSPDESSLDTHNHYTNSDGQSVHSPAKSTTGAIPDGATAKCRDGSYSFSQHHRGTCSHHGGVGTWL